MDNNKPVAVVVEDDPDLSEIFSEALSKAGYQAFPCLNGESAREAFTRLRADLVLLDLHLPDVSGIDLLHTIRSTSHLAKVKVILATADPVLANLYQDQVDIVLIKPISFIQLRDLATRLA